MTRTYDAYAWPGGYPIVWYDQDNEPTCAPCAVELSEDDPDLQFTPAIHYEGPSIFCSNKNERIDSAYGDDMTHWTTDQVTHDLTDLLDQLRTITYSHLANSSAYQSTLDEIRDIMWDPDDPERPRSPDTLERIAQVLIENGWGPRDA